MIATHFNKVVYEPLLSSNVPNVHENTVSLLKTLKDHIPDVHVDSIQDALRETELMEDSKLEVDLLQRLNLDGTISQKDVLLIKKIGEEQYGDVWQAKYHGFPMACKILKRQLTPKDAEKVLE